MNDQMIKDLIKQLYIPSQNSHKGQNGKLLIIGGSQLFHAASLWALQVASRIVDLVHYSSTEENNKLVFELKKEFRNGIVVPREKIEEYINEDDCVLIGPGMVRAEGEHKLSAFSNQLSAIKDIDKIKDEGEQTAALTNYLLSKYPHKQWIIDAGALQMMDVNLIPQNAILTPHKREFILLLQKITNHKSQITKNNQDPNSKITNDIIKNFAKEHNCIVLLKGEEDIVCNSQKCGIIKGGNSGMTKGGTGDVLAGLVAALACKNDPYLASVAASFINKKAGERLFKKVGFYFNASDLAGEIPGTLKDFRGI